MKRDSFFLPLQPLLPFLAFLVLTAAAPAKRTFTGVVSDDMCATAGHASMKMGADDAECTRACMDAHGALLVLVSGKNTYILSDQKTPVQFAGSRVRVVGTLDAK